MCLGGLVHLRRVLLRHRRHPHERLSHGFDVLNDGLHLFLGLCQPVDDAWRVVFVLFVPLDCRFLPGDRHTDVGDGTESSGEALAEDAAELIACLVQAGLGSPEPDGPQLGYVERQFAALADEDHRLSLPVAVTQFVHHVGVACADIGDHDVVRLEPLVDLVGDTPVSAMASARSGSSPCSWQAARTTSS